MELPKYRFLTAYTLEEVRRAYTRADAQGRIALLKSLYDDHSIHIVPFEIANLAVNDEHLAVREWIALNGKWLDYSERHFGEPAGVDLLPERNLEEKLKLDRDPFVRARLRENPTAWNWDVLGEFQKANHLERLALIRNPEIGRSHGRTFLKHLFDHTSDLPVTLDERKELIVGFLSNREAISELTDPHRNSDTDLISILWELAAKWPHSPDSDVRKKNRLILMPHYVYLYLPGDDDTKAKIYRMEEDRICRLWILESCSPDDVQTLELGKKDNDKHCRETARYMSKKASPTDQEYDENLKQKKNVEENNHQAVITFLTRLGIAMIVVKLYLPEWSNLALVAGIAALGFAIADFLSSRVVRYFERRKEKNELHKAIGQLYHDQSLEKARDLLENGVPAVSVSKETGLSMKTLKQDGLVD